MLSHLKKEESNVNIYEEYQAAVPEAVAKEMKTRLPNKFRFVFVCWSASDIYHLVTYASYLSKTKLGYTLHLLGFSTLERKEHPSADQHLKHIDFVLELFEKFLDNVVSIIAFKKGNCGFIRCVSHPFNLAVNKVVEENIDVIQQVTSIMKKLSFLVRRTKLKNCTLVASIKSNNTRLGSVFFILEQDGMIWEHFSHLVIEQVTVS